MQPNNLANRQPSRRVVRRATATRSRRVWTLRPGHCERGKSCTSVEKQNCAGTQPSGVVHLPFEGQERMRREMLMRASETVLMGCETRG